MEEWLRQFLSFYGLRLFLGLTPLRASPFYACGVSMG